MFFICPDCGIEIILRNEFGDDIIFLTALGSVFDFEGNNYSQELDYFINQEDIGEIVVVNDSDCTFIINTINNYKKKHTIAEKELERLKTNHAEQFEPLEATQQQKLLASLNIYRQAYEITDIPSLSEKFADGKIDVKGLLYDRANHKFEQLKMKL
ncbi:hypothetical protein A0256_22180 [Mucilaginibacter sp. PAMC 26640]|nr:hypothetical protein A0256_22180 [Mucilaginibacter sp. PAMC 26640]